MRPLLLDRSRPWLAAAALFAFLSQAFAQGDGFLYSMNGPPVEFDKSIGSLGSFGSLANKAFKPEAGSAPFPAVVIGHTCGGAGQAHIRSRARELLASGFAVLVVDSYAPRGISSCRGQFRVNQQHQAVDAYAALLHLRHFSEIDRSRIYYAGYSAGGMAAALLASRHYAPPAAEPVRFRALVSHYASCVFQHGPNTPRMQLLFREADTPILMLMADRDFELRPSDCFPQLEEMKAAGKPVEWHVYKDTHHAWDQPGVSYTHMNGFGQPTVYAYSAAATADSTRRMVEFFNQHR